MASGTSQPLPSIQSVAEIRTPSGLSAGQTARIAPADRVRRQLLQGAGLAGLAGAGMAGYAASTVAAGSSTAAAGPADAGMSGAAAPLPGWRLSQVLIALVYAATLLTFGVVSASVLLWHLPTLERDHEAQVQRQARDFLRREVTGSDFLAGWERFERGAIVPVRVEGSRATRCASRACPSPNSVAAKPSTSTTATASWRSSRAAPRTPCARRSRG